MSTSSKRKHLTEKRQRNKPCHRKAEGGYAATYRHRLERHAMVGAHRVNLEAFGFYKVQTKLCVLWSATNQKLASSIFSTA